LSPLYQVIIKATTMKQLCYCPLLSPRYIRLIVVEALRLYPQPPLLIRRSLKSDVLPGIDFYRILNKDAIETNFTIVIDLLKNIA